ncbi:hypothetical protein BN59_01802 [Legionella massiliensis]|uniref:UPF0276 protein BN59_01802 n=1 Tax=Legionella massiliensis TaxID=1034943 RepID=A0A078L0E8_9GAMM|nr:DUF692 domain-containing protein [Legionella massiliensis]CDZ77519.1 hypothetical protein BN59_01802 [Legionella massiliensis]CEE13257.1 hypothetical protein BN1094_01802 [Legionella massiliensis]
MKNRQLFPYLGFGLGLRPEHYEDVLQEKPDVDWFEIITENYLVPGGKPLYFLDKVRENYPIVMHGVSLSIGSTDPIDWDYLKQVKSLAERAEPIWISDHLCWTGVKGLNMHDLLPIPYTEEAIKHIVARINEIQDFLGRRILIENVSSYLTFIQSQITEWEFISEIAQRADCYILLDVNNIYVSSVNHDFNAMDYINFVPPERVVQIHLAGHSDYGSYIIDTHDAPIIQPVWDLYAKAIAKLGRISTMIERDDNIPPLSELLDELNLARNIMANTPEGLLA